MIHVISTDDDGKPQHKTLCGRDRALWRPGAVKTATLGHATCKTCIKIGSRLHEAWHGHHSHLAERARCEDRVCIVRASAGISLIPSYVDERLSTADALILHAVFGE